MTGLSHVLELRGPKQYVSSFDRELLVASKGGVVSMILAAYHEYLLTRTQYAEALFSNRPCFLGESAWQEVILEPILSSTGEPSKSWDVHGMTAYLCLIPELLVDLRATVRGAYEQSPESIHQLKRKAEDLRSVFVDVSNIRKWDISRLTNVMDTSTNTSLTRLFFNHDDLVTANFCHHRKGMILLNRIIYALDPAATENEEETKRYAEEVVRLHAGIFQDNRLGPVHRILSLRTAQAALCTADAWAERDCKEAMIEGSVCNAGIVLPAAFKQFDDYISGHY